MSRMAYWHWARAAYFGKHAYLKIMHRAAWQASASIGSVSAEAQCQLVQAEAFLRLLALKDLWLLMLTPCCAVQKLPRQDQSTKEQLAGVHHCALLTLMPQHADAGDILLQGNTYARHESCCGASRVREITSNAQRSPQVYTLLQRSGPSTARRLQGRRRRYIGSISGARRSSLPRPFR